MDNQQQTPNQVRQIIWGLSKLALYTDPMGEGNKRKPRLGLDYTRKNRVRITARTNIPDDKDYGRLTVELDPLRFGTFLSLLEKAIAFRPTAEEKEFKGEIKTFRPDFRNPGQGQKVPAGDLLVGKDAAGMVWICVYHHQRPCPKFNFIGDDFFVYRHGSGEQFSPAEVSVLTATNWCRIIRDTLPHLAIEHFTPEEFGKKPGNGNGGGYNGGGNRNGGGYGGNNNSGGYNGGSSGGSGGGYPDTSSDADEDLPY